MATFFSKLPLEVRNQIYEELLVKDHRFFVVDEPSVHKNKGNLHPAILFTCRQAYHEASAVLYGQNHLRYTKLPSSAKDGLPIDNLEKIKHLEVAHSSIAMTMEKSTKLKANLETVNQFTAAIKSIATSAHSLKTLRILFEFSWDREPVRHVENRSDYVYHSVNIVAKYAQSQDLQKAISDLCVKDKIIIETETFGFHHHFYDPMVDFVDKIRSLKDWALTGRYHNWAQSYCEEETDTWAWILEPVTTVTKDKRTDCYGVSTSRSSET